MELVKQFDFILDIILIYATYAESIMKWNLLLYTFALEIENRNSTIYTNLKIK